MINLDLKDSKILYELDSNSRQPYNEIAKKVGLSKDSVIYRIKRLQKEGIIKQFHTIVDAGKLGFISFRLYLKLQNTTPEKQNEIVAFLKNKAMVTWLVSIEGEYDIGMWILTKSIREMNNLWKELLHNYVNFIDKRWFTIFTKVSYFPRSYLLDKKENLEEYVFITEPQESKLKKLDLDILHMLAPDARISIVHIAKKLRITPKTAATRLRELERSKVIVGYRAMFDLEKLGYQYFKVHFNIHNITEEKEKQFRTYFKTSPIVIYDNEMLGGDDFEIEVQVRTLQDLRSFIDDTKKQFADIIKNYTYMLFYKEHKFVFIPV